ncbi:hypothetical protein JW964_08880, partial [candidate division KSB1 bacterium]|nr:hypothetical protein [candidate division KSB1 bacterium]
TLPPMRIVMLHDGHFIPLQAEKCHLVLARIAGFDTAVYGLADTPPSPLLFEHPNRSILVATSTLSQFVRGRFAPTEAWTAIWRMILNWVQPELGSLDLQWQPTVHPGYARPEPLPEQAHIQAIRRGIDWFFNAKMLLHPLTCPRYDNESRRWQECSRSPSDWPSGDGSLGVLEGFRSKIRLDGSQEIVYWRRNDCNAEVAGAMALAGHLFRNETYLQTARNILEFLYTQSIMTGGDRQDPANPAFGLIGWHDVRHYHQDLNGYDVYYGDDNARGLLGTMLAAAILQTDQWDERILQCLLANLRTTGTLGFRDNRLEQQSLEENGWKYYFNKETISYAPHYQAYLWACYLWAFQHTRNPCFLERTKTAIRMTMEAYPDQWRWTNGLQQERARILLPLAWLVRVEDTPKHRQWLKEMAEALLAYQDTTGAIREILGEAGQGKYKAPESNAAYGTTEAPLIQRNGDPVCDLLYTTNFALLGLHEAAAATGDAYYVRAEQRLIDFLCRIQVKSTLRPELDGAWFRAFDFNRWEYWASNADAGWGAWCVETGWTQGWITSVLALNELNQNLWELTAGSKISEFRFPSFEF